jgi:hypothetical protein
LRVIRIAGETNFITIANAVIIGISVAGISAAEEFGQRGQPVAIGILIAVKEHSRKAWKLRFVGVGQAVAITVSQGIQNNLRV